MLKSFVTQTINLQSGELPDRLVVMKWGESEINGGEVLRVNSTTLNHLKANQDRYSFDRVALDFNHNTVPDSEAYQGEPAPVAAYASVEVIEGEGLVFTDLEWTPEGKQFVGGGHYCDLSPTVKLNDANEVIFIHSAAACRQGQIRGLSLYSAADPFNSNQKTMDYKNILTALLGLEEGATEEAIETGAKALASKMDEMQTMASSLTELKTKLDSFSSEPGKLDDEQAGRIKVLVADVDTLKQDVKALSSRNETLERDGIRREALNQGKIIPASADKLGLDDFRSLVSELPADQVPLSKRTPDGLKEFSAKSSDDGSAAIRGQLGISKEDWDKHNS